MGPKGPPGDPAASQFVHDPGDAALPKKTPGKAPDNRPKITPTGAKKPGTGTKKPGTGTKSNNKDGQSATAKPQGKVPETKGNTKRPADEGPSESPAKKPKLPEGRTKLRYNERWYEANIMTR